MKAYALTDVGLMRQKNEDDFDVIADVDFYVVADGMGGHASGQVASKICVESLRKYLLEMSQTPEHEFIYPVPDGAGPPERLLSNAIQYANERIYIESMKDLTLEGMGTTVVCAMGFENVLILGHVGDSRIYRYRNGNLEAVTRDHSLLNHYIDEGKITSPEEKKNFKEGNVILKALGLKDYVEPEIRVIDRQPNDLFLMCTDGLTDQVEDWVIANVLDGNEDNLDEACKVLVKLANEAGGKDNCTVLLLEVDGEQVAPVVSTNPSTEMNRSDDPMNVVTAEVEVILEPTETNLVITEPEPSAPYLTDESEFGFDDDEDEVTDPNVDIQPLPSASGSSIQIDPEYAAEAKAAESPSDQPKKKKRRTLIDRVPDGYVPPDYD